METLVLTRSEVEQALSPVALLGALRSGFAAYSTQRSIDAMRVPVLLPQQRAGASGMLLAPGLVPGIPAYSVKVHAKFPGGNPAIRGVLILHDLQTGAPLAIMESTHGRDHAFVAICLNNLAGLLRDTNRLSEAETLYNRALAIVLFVLLALPLEQHLDPGHAPLQLADDAMQPA